MAVLDLLSEYGLWRTPCALLGCWGTACCQTGGQLLGSLVDIGLELSFHDSRSAGGEPAEYIVLPKQRHCSRLFTVLSIWSPACGMFT